MNIWRRTITGLFVGGLFLSAPEGRAKEDYQSRLTPVPADQPVPVADFFRPWSLTNPKLNPAGTHFAALVSTQKDRSDLLIFELTTKKAERLSGGDDFDIFDYTWLSDSRVVYYVGWGKRYASGLYSAQVGKLSNAQAVLQYSVVVPVGLPVADPTQAIIWVKNEAETRGADGGVFKIDVVKVGKPLPTGVPRLNVIKRYPALPVGDPLGYLADRNGELAFSYAINDGILSLYSLAEDKWVRSPLNLEEASVLGVGDGPGEVLATLTDDPNKPAAVHRVDVATGSAGNLLFSDEKYDPSLGRIYRHPVDKRALGLSYSRKQPQTVWFDESYASVQKLLESSFPKETVRIVGSDREQKQFFVSVSSDVRPPTYYMFNLGTGDVVRVVEVAPWIESKRMRPISYKARDGVEIEGYLTLPADTSKEKPAPLVVLPHGGPWVRDTWGWDGEVQFLASRGYAVLQPNYRGSTGYRLKIPRDDHWAFRKMHDDVTDGVRAVLKTGLVDPDRVAIMGASFGGYLALSGAAHEGGLYRCAITIAGVFDWEQMMEEARSNDITSVRYGWYRLKLGDPQKEQKKFEEISPLRHVEKITIPLYVAHGAEDQTASIKQSKRLITELKTHGIPYEKQFEAGEGHGFQKLDNQVELYTAIEAFLAKHMAPK